MKPSSIILFTHCQSNCCDYSYCTYSCSSPAMLCYSKTHYVKQKFSNAFRNAFNGLKYFFRQERNGKIQLFIAFAMVLTGLALQISFFEWISILLCIGLVIGLEIMNSALEKMCNMIQPGFHPTIKIIKDAAASSVLFASIISAIIGCIIFFPKIYALL